MNVYRWETGPVQPGIKALNYLRRSLPLIPESALKNAFRSKDVKMNGVRISPEDHILAGAVMEVYTAAGAVLSVIYEDERVLVINKPAGLCTQDVYCGMTVQTLAQAHCGENCEPRLCHRLDTRTSGLLVIAKDDESEREITGAFKNRDVSKEYECLVKGEMRPKEAMCQAYLIKDAEVGRVRVISHRTPGAKEIKTAYRTLSMQGEISRLRVQLLTGRTHQIRAHLAYLGHPLLGDDIYGDREFSRRNASVGNLKLCAVSLTLRFSPGSLLRSLDGREFTVPAPF